MRLFGLIGKTLGHSFSPGFFTEKFRREGILDCSYKLYALPRIDDFIPLIQNNPDICGLNVTIPYKQEIMPLLDEIDPIAHEIGAVNTIKIFRNRNTIKLTGFNTDVSGFKLSYTNQTKNLKALVLGTGGSAMAVKYVLHKWNVPFYSVSRTPTTKGEIGYMDLDKDLIRTHQLIINTTPLGMFPYVDACPPIPYHLLTNRHFLYDLIYNPGETKFLQLGRAAGADTQNGLLMLELQAEKSWEIWNL
jgi:shikimate dehydrogenase